MVESGHGPQVRQRAEVASPRLDEQRHAAGETPLHRSRKDTKRWCRGKVGVEHVTETRRNRWGLYFQQEQPQRGLDCKWQENRRWRNYADHREYEGIGTWDYSCWHERACVNCGKVITPLHGRECPDWKPRV